MIGQVSRAKKKLKKDYKSGDLPKVKPFATFHRHVNQVFPEITIELRMHKC